MSYINHLVISLIDKKIMPNKLIKKIKSLSDYPEDATEITKDEDIISVFIKRETRYGNIGFDELKKELETKGVSNNLIFEITLDNENWQNVHVFVLLDGEFHFITKYSSDNE